MQPAWGRGWGAEGWADTPRAAQCPCLVCPVQAVCQGGRSSASLGEPSVGAWLRALGLERYEEGLIHNGWDDLEFLR